MARNIILCLLVLATGVTACRDVIEPNISSTHIKLLAPLDSGVTTIMLQTFWWETIDGADFYNLQIVSPSFTNVSQLLLDTNIYRNKCIFSLLPGKYEWRVCGQNFAYSTPYSINRLVIDSTPDISHQTIRLVIPVDLDTTNISSFLFEWELLYNAENYNFQLYFGVTRIIGEDIEVDTVRFTLSQGDGPYVWKVRGQNSSSNTPYSSRSIFLDTQPPPAPLLVSPPANARLAADSLIQFIWNRPEVHGSSIHDSLVIAKDSLFTIPVKSVYVASPIYMDSLTTGIYFWHVRSIDKAGNKSDYSQLRKIFIN